MASRLRPFLVLLLAVTLDCSVPVGSEASTPQRGEGSVVYEEFQETMHRGRGRRVLHIVRHAARSRTMNHVVASSEVRTLPGPRLAPPASRPASDARPRKDPPRELAPAPTDDH